MTANDVIFGPLWAVIDRLYKGMAGIRRACRALRELKDSLHSQPGTAIGIGLHATLVVEKHHVA